MTDTLRIGQIGIAHTHASKLVDAPSPAVLQRLNTELVGIHEPDAAMFAERRARDTWIDNPQQIFDDDSISIVFIETWPWDCLEWGRRAAPPSKRCASSTTSPRQPDCAFRWVTSGASAPDSSSRSGRLDVRQSGSHPSLSEISSSRL